jgi:CHAD domain-containing protein
VLATSLPAAVEGDPVAMHRARVASRRLREALGVVEALKLDARVGGLRRDARRSGKAIGPLRELLVAEGELTKAAARHGWQPDTVARIERRLEQQREQRQPRMHARLETIDVERCRERVSAILSRLNASSASDEWREIFSAFLTTRAGRTMAAIDACGTLYLPDTLHDLRIETKKCRYLLELGVAAHLPGLKPVARALKRVQRGLGQLHDLQVLQDDINAAMTTSRSDEAALAAAVEDLERDCRTWHAELLPHFADLRECLVTLAKNDGLPRRMIRIAQSTAPGAVKPLRLARTVHR